MKDFHLIPADRGVEIKEYEYNLNFTKIKTEICK